MVFAQKGVYVNTIGGISFPFSGLADKSWVSENNCGGFALPGYHASLQTRLMFSATIGLVVAGNVMGFSLDNAAIERQVYNPLTDSFVRAESGGWYFRFIEAGPVINFPLSEKWSWELSLSGSYYRIRYPYLRRIIADKTGIPVAFTRETPLAKTFSLTTVAGLNKSINENLYLTLHTGLFFSMPEFKFTDNTSKTIVSMIVSAGLGLMYKF